MSLCPFCRKVLTPTEVTGGVCPKCGNNLPFRRGAQPETPPAQGAAPAGGPVPSVLDEDLGSSIQQLNETLGALGAPQPPTALPPDKPEKPNHPGGKTIEIGRVAPARTLTPEEIAARLPVVPPPRKFGGGAGMTVPVKPETPPTSPAADTAKAGEPGKAGDTGRASPPAGRTIQIERTATGGLAPMAPMSALPPLPPVGQKPAGGPGIGKTIQIERTPGGLAPMAPPGSAPAGMPPVGQFPGGQTPGGQVPGGQVGGPTAQAPGGAPPPKPAFPAGKTMQMGREALDALRPAATNIPAKPPGFQPMPGAPAAQTPTSPAAPSSPTFSGAQTIPGIVPMPGGPAPAGASGFGGAPPSPASPPVGGFADPSGRTMAIGDALPGGFGGPPSSPSPSEIGMGRPAAPPVVPGARTLVGGAPELGPGSSGFGPMNLAPSAPSAPAGRTVNIGSGGANVDQAIAEGWATVTGGGRPGSTIKGSSRVGFSPNKSHLVVRTRALSDSRWLKGKGPRPSTERLPPEMQPDYELIDVLGEGGMGVVYSARQASIDRTVAIKMLKPEMAQDLSLRAKFLTEAAVTGDLDHPNIVAIHELGSNEAGALFYSMRRVRGTPWLEVIRQKTQVENIETWQRVADAIAFAHSRGVIHRDIKPENVMLGDFGEVLVMDWGLALSVREQGKADSIYTSDCLAGTPAYMAPEMALGPVTSLGVWSDIYLLGAILYEIITGSPPHTGDTATECLYAVGRNLIQPTDKKGELVDIAVRAMETDPNLRFPTVLELQSAVRQYQSHSESVALSTRAEDDLERAKKTKSYDDFAQALFGFKEAFSLWEDNSSAMHGVSRAKLAYGEAAFDNGDLDLASSLLDPKDPTHAAPLEKLRLARIERDARQRRLKVFTQTVRALVAVFVVTLTVGMYWINSERKAAQIAEGKATEAADAAKKAEGEARDAEGKTKIALKDAVEARELAIEEEKKAKASEKAAKEAREQSEKDRDAAEVARKEALERKKEADIAKDTAVGLQKKSEKEAYLALVGLTAEKVNENSHGQARELLDSCAEKLRQWEWGRLLFECQLHSQALVGPGGPINSVQYWTSKDGNYAITAGSGGAWVWDATPVVDRAPVTKTQPLFVLEAGGDLEFLAVAFAPSKQGRPTRLATVSVISEKDPNPVKLWTIDWDAKTAKSEPFANGMSKHRGQVTNAIFSPEGDRLLTCGEDKSVRMWDLSNGQMLYRFGGHNEAVTSAAFSPPGAKVARIITVSLDGSANIWTRNPDPSKRGTVMEWGTPASPPIPPAGDSPGAPGVPAEWGSPQIFRGHTGPIYAVAFSPEGDRVITGSADKTAVVWEPAQEHEFFYEKLLGKSAPPGQLPARRVVLAGHTGAVRSVAFSPDVASGLVLTASDDNTVRVWNAQDGEVVQTVEGEEYRRVGQLRQVPRANDYIHVTGKLKSTLRGHGNPVRSAAFSSDGSFILSGSFDKEAKIWDLANYVEGKRSLAVTEGRKQGSLLAGAYSVKGDRVITAGTDGEARVWNVANFDKPNTLSEGHDYLVTSVLVSADNQRIVTGAGDGTVRIWNVANGAEVNRFLNTGRSGGAALSRDGSFLVTGSAKPRERKAGEKEPNYDENLVAKVWAVDSGTVKFVLGGHRAKVSALALSLDDKWIVTGDEEGGIRLWDAATGQFAKSLNGHGLRITSLAFSPDGKSVYSASSDNSVIGWNAAEGSRKYTITLGDGGTCLAASKRYLLTGQVDGLVRLWDAETGTDLNWTLGTGSRSDKTKLVSITSISFPPTDDKRALVISSDNKVRMLAEAERGFKVLGERPLEMRIQPNLPPHLVWAGAFTRDGEGLVTCGDRDAQIWSMAGGKPRFVRRFAPHRQLTAAAFAKRQVVVGQLVNDNLAVTAGERTAKLWDVDSGKAIAELIEIHSQKINSVDLSPDNQQILTASDDKTAVVWSVKHEKDQATVTKGLTLEHAARVHSAVFSPKGDLILTACDDRTAILWDAATGKKLAVLGGRDGHTLAVVHATFSPDGKRVITSSEDTKAKVWELPENFDGQAQPVLKGTLSGHSAATNFASFDPAGTPRALTASDDGTAKLWDLEQFSEILTLSGHTDAVTSVTFSPDSSSCLTTSYDSTAIVWPARDWKNPQARAGAPKEAKPEEKPAETPAEKKSEEKKAD